MIIADDGERILCDPNKKSPPGLDSNVAPYQSNVPRPNKPFGVSTKDPSKLACSILIDYL